MLFRAADQSPELLGEHLQSHQHYKPLEYGKSQGAGGQEEEKEELGKTHACTDVIDHLDFLRNVNKFTTSVKMTPSRFLLRFITSKASKFRKVFSF